MLKDEYIVILYMYLIKHQLYL